MKITLKKAPPVVQPPDTVIIEMNSAEAHELREMLGACGVGPDGQLYGPVCEQINAFKSPLESYLGDVYYAHTYKYKRIVDAVVLAFKQAGVR